MASVAAKIPDQIRFADREIPRVGTLTKARAQANTESPLGMFSVEHSFGRHSGVKHRRQSDRDRWISALLDVFRGRAARVFLLRFVSFVHCKD
jgi:hypothetical protein